MFGASHLSLRGGVYYYVRRVPKSVLNVLRGLSRGELQALEACCGSYFGTSLFVRVSLRTHNKTEASRRALSKAVEFDRKQLELERWIETYRGQVGKDLKRLGEGSPVNQADVWPTAQEHPPVHALQNVNRVAVSTGTELTSALDIAQLLTKIEQRLSSVQQQIGENSRPTLHAFGRAEQPHEEKFEADFQKVATTATLGEVIDAYLTQLPENEFLRKVKRALNLFGQYVGRENSIVEVRQVAVTHFLRDACKLPRDWFRKHKPDTPLRELIRGDSEIEGISEPTWTDNYKAPLGTFLRAAHRDFGDGGFKMLTVEGIKYAGKRFINEEQQRGLSVAEVQKLVQSQKFHALSHDSDGGPLYWLTLIMLFTGARPREICQINPQVDFGEVEGCWYVDINDKSDTGKGVKKTVKTGESRRLPLHLTLVELGLPSYLEEMRESGADRLFPEVRVKRGNPYVVLGAQFSQLLRDVNLYDDRAPAGRKVLGAYSLRKTFITLARDQGVISKEITGHSDDQTTAIQRRHYITEPEPLVRKAHELSKYKLPLSIPRRT